MIRILFLLLISLFCYDTLLAQQPPLKVWLNENFPAEYAYLRNETPWIDYVRNRGDADVQVQLTRETLAASQRHVLYFYGANRFEGQHDTVFFDSRPVEPFNSYRERLLRAYKHGLLSYLVQLPEAANLSFEPVEPLLFAETPYRDWGKWVCTAGGGGSLSGSKYYFGETYSINSRSINISPDINLWRVTRNHRLWANASYNNNFGSITSIQFIGKDTTKINNKTFRFSAGFAHALNRQWSAGAWVDLRETNMLDYRTSGVFGGPLNREVSTELIQYSAALEYSVLPFESFFRHRWLAGYQIIFTDQQSEQDNYKRPFSQRLYTNAAKLTSWGALSGNLSLTHQPRKEVWDHYSFNVQGSMLINLKKSLYFSASLGSTWVNQTDFSSLAPGLPLPDSKNARTLSLNTNIGLIYSFGAEHLNILNPRLGAL